MCLENPTPPSPVPLRETTAQLKVATSPLLAHAARTGRTFGSKRTPAS